MRVVIWPMFNIIPRNEIMIIFQITINKVLAICLVPRWVIKSPSPKSGIWISLLEAAGKKAFTKGMTVQRVNE